MSHTRSECTCQTPAIQRFLTEKSIDWYVLTGQWIREGRLTRRFTDFPLDAYDLA